jgi:hypothetical protein
MPLPFATWVIPDRSPRSSVQEQEQWAQRWRAHWCASLDPAGQREAMEAWLQEPSAQDAFL